MAERVSFDRGPGLHVVMAGGDQWFQARIVRKGDTVYVVARQNHYPEHPVAGRQVALLWSGVATIEATGAKSWTISQDGTVVATIDQPSRLGCGCGEPIWTWSP